jgi:multiple sugar transport system ATP-binding protein
VLVDGVRVDVPVVAEDVAEQSLVLGVRPEHVALRDDAPLRARVVGTEYMGTTQVVTLESASGVMVRARAGATLPVRAGDQVGLALASPRLSLFRKSDGRAIRTEARGGAGG